jgi:hypothetical protein
LDEFKQLQPRLAAGLMQAHVDAEAKGEFSHCRNCGLVFKGEPAGVGFGPGGTGRGRFVMFCGSCWSSEALDRS